MSELTITYIIEDDHAVVSGCSGTGDTVILASEYEGYPVTKIKSQVFWHNSKIKTAILADSITEIGYENFIDCTNLESITLPDSLVSTGTNFCRGCSKLSKIYFGSKAVTFGNSSFYNCSSVLEIHLKNIEAWCGTDFKSRYNFSTNYAIYLNGELVTDLVIPDSVTELKHDVFYGCSSIQTVKLGSGITVVEDSTFYNCTNLLSLELGYNTTTLGNYALYGCGALTTLKLGNAFNKGGDYLFAGVNALVRIDITNLANWCTATWSSYGSSKPDLSKIKLYYNNILIENLVLDTTVTQFSWDCFRGDTDLKTVSIYGNITYWGYWRTNNYGVFQNCANLTSVQILNDINNIGINAFNGCTALTEVYCSKSIKNINSNAFFGCSSLSLATLGSRLEEVGGYAFYNCTNIQFSTDTSFKNITTLGNQAFYNCSNLTTIDLSSMQNLVYSSYNYSPFYGCSQLQDVTFGAALKTLGNSRGYSFIFGWNTINTVRYNGTPETWETVVKPSSTWYNNLLISETAINTGYFKVNNEKIVVKTLGTEVIGLSAKINEVQTSINTLNTEIETTDKLFTFEAVYEKEG